MSNWLVTSTPPTIDLDAVKRHCRVPVEYTNDDDVISQYIDSAIAQVERVTERVLGQGTAVFYGMVKCVEVESCNVFDALDITCLPLLPDQDALDPLRDGIISVEYLNNSDAWVAIDSAYWQLYRPGEEPPTLLIQQGHDVDIKLTSPTPYKITIRVGYETLPPNALQAIKLWAGECYRFREVLVYGQTSVVFKNVFDSECRALQWRFKG